MDLKALQSRVSQVRKEREFTMDPLRIFILLQEEIGEVARERKRTWPVNYAAFAQEDLEDELADVLVCLLALANQFDFDLETVVLGKLVHKDERRTWRSAEKRGKII